jgi:hypothetical protein
MTKPPELLYHYTTAEGLLGILDKRCLWMTAVGYVNDHTETMYAYEAAYAQFRKLAKGIPLIGPLIEPICERMRHMQPSTAGNQRFVACLSEHADSLGQWRGYSSMGSAYAIGFRTNVLASLSERNMIFVKCLYKLEEQERLLLEWANGLAESCERSMLTGASPNEIVHDNGGGAFDWLREYVGVRMPAFLKNSHFEPEAEWRLVRNIEWLTPAGISFRPGRGTLIPYTKIQFTHEELRAAVSSVTIGPTARTQDATQALASLLSVHNLDAAVLHSTVPYREP